jgi:outer membrane protein
MLSKLIVLALTPALCLAQGPSAPRDTNIVSKKYLPMQDTALHPISLQTAVTMSQKNNIAAVQAQGAIQNANLSVRSAYGEYYPSVSLTGGQTKSAGQRLNTQTGTLTSYAGSWGYNAGVSGQVTLFDGFKARDDIRTQKANVVAAQAGEVSTDFSLALQVKTQYISILAARESEASALSQLQYADEQLNASVARVAAGAATKSDSLRSVIVVGSAQLALLQARNGIETGSAALTHLVGTSYLVTANPADTIDRPLTNFDSLALVQMALGGPAIRQSEAQLNSQIAAQQAAKTAYFPQVTLSLSGTGSGTGNVYGLSPLANDSLPQGCAGGAGRCTAFGPTNTYPYSHTLGLNFTFPLFNRWQRENSIATAEISVVTAQATLRDQKLSAQQNILTQLAALSTAQEQIRIGLISVQAAEEDLRVQQQRYAVGASALLDVLNSQSALVTAQQQLISARQSYRIARAQIEAIIGRDLQ